MKGSATEEARPGSLGVFGDGGGGGETGDEAE